MTGAALGIGLLYQSAIGEFLADPPASLGYVEVIPDTVWRDLGPTATPRFVEDGPLTRAIEALAARLPVVPHSIGLSIGSATPFDTAYVEQLAGWQRRFGAPWHSEHLAFSVAELDGETVNAGLTLPVTLDRATIELIVPRIEQVREAVAAPFLLENNVYYFGVPDEEYAEPELLSILCERTGCGLLLDLHNLYVNVRNRGVDSAAYLDAFDLSRVVEIHVAGGMEVEGYYVDAHSGSPPEPVWELLADVVPQCPNLRGVTLELLGSWYDVLGPDRLAADLDRLAGVFAPAVRR